MTRTAVYTFSLIGMIRYLKPLASRGLDQSGTQGADQLQEYVALVDRLEPIAQEVRVESDLQRLPLERDRQRFLRFTDVRRLRRDGQLAGRERQSQRGILLRQQADAANDVGELRTAKRSSCSKLSGSSWR